MFVYVHCHALTAMGAPSLAAPLARIGENARVTTSFGPRCGGAGLMRSQQPGVADVRHQDLGEVLGRSGREARAVVPERPIGLRDGGHGALVAPSMEVLDATVAIRPRWRREPSPVAALRLPAR